MDNIDREIKKILENLPPKDNIPEIIIDKRTDNFWNVNREWVPIRHQKEYLEYEYSPIADELDHIYHRYIVEPKEQGLLSDDYTVRDIENQFVSYSLVDFLNMYDNGLLPIDMVYDQQLKLKHRDNILILFFICSVIGLVALIIEAIFHHGSVMNVPSHYVWSR